VLGGRVKYRTIVADPPWQYPEGWGRPPGGQGERMALRAGIAPEMRVRRPLPYPSMSQAAIEALPVAELADPDGCHLYLWTTNRHLHAAFHVLDAWGFRFGQALTWCKAPMGAALGGAFSPTTEFILTARRGSLRHLERVDSTWFRWPRMDRAHSRKPDAFLDLVERVSPAPRLEMFARRQRLGWDTWGNEALEHVELPA